jgi:hypothetical protein
MTTHDGLTVQVNGQMFEWNSALTEFLADSGRRFGGRICFSARESGFCLDLIWGNDDCSILLWSDDSAPATDAVGGLVFHSTSEWNDVLDSLTRFVDDDYIKMVIITNRWNPAQELRLWKKDDGSLGIAGTYPSVTVTLFV